MRKVLLALILPLMWLPITALAAGDAYLYNDSGQTVPSLAEYEPSDTITGADLGVGSLSGSSDLFIRDGIAYIADAEGNRILAVDLQAKSLIEVVDHFDNAGTQDGFDKPQGVFVTSEGDMYVADTQHYRVVHLAKDRALVKVIESPQAEVISEDYVFKPQKLAVDAGGRVYVVAEATTAGLTQFASDGSFISFFGGNEVKADVGELLLRMFLTKEQRQKRSTFIPVEYSNLAIDGHNFLYTTTVNTYENQVRRLNFQGSNIMRYTGRFHARLGDMDDADLPYMVDVTVDGGGNFAALDFKRGRVYRYNQLGELLAIFGGYGSQDGQFRSPVAVDEMEGAYYVLDSVKASITVFTPTDFGTLVVKANDAYFAGEYEEAKAYWTQVLARNANYDLAYKSLGNAALRERQYAQAMDYYRRANDKDGYSKAFKSLRTQWMRAHFALVMSAAVVLVALLIATRKPRARLLLRMRAYYGLD